MPITVSLPSRNVELEFPDSMTEQEIAAAIEQEYPRSGEDVAYEVEQAKTATIEGRDLVNPFEGMSNDDYALFRKHLAEKKTSLGDALGIAADTFGAIVSEVGKAAGATGEAVLGGEFGAAGESAVEGMVAGTVGLADIADKIFQPARTIPSKEEFLKRKIETGKPAGMVRGDFGVEEVAIPSFRPATEADYAALIEQEKQRDAEATNRLYAMEATLRGAPIEEIARGFQYVDPTLLASLGGTAAAKLAGKTLFKGAARTAAGRAAAAIPTPPVGAAMTIESGEAIIPAAMRTAPGAIGQAALAGVERAAGAVESVAGLPSRAITAVGNIAENIAPGTGLPTRGAAVATTMMGGAGIPLAGAAATEKAAEVVGSVARAARQEASRAGLLERAAMDVAISPAARKVAAGLAQIQPGISAAGRLTAQAAKEGAAGAVVGSGLGYLAEGNLEGAAAGAGAGAAIGGLSGTLRSSFDLGREMLGKSTSRTREQATGDLNRFLGERPEVEQAAWGETINRLVQQVGPERAAAQVDAMRVAEANGARVRVATPDEMKQWQNPGWLNVDGMEVVLNPSRILGDTASHETAHVLFSSVINRAFRPEIETAIFGLADPVTGEIVRPGLFDDADLAKVADQIGDSYGTNTQAANEFRGYANVLRNSTDSASLQNARTRIADEMTAAYTGRLFNRIRPGRFNPDRLPLAYRKALNALEDGILDKFRSVLFEKGMDLGFNNVTKTFTNEKGKPIRIPELDAIVKRAMAKKGTKEAAAPTAKPDLIPAKPADRVIWARSYGGARGILNDDGTPKSEAQVNAEAAARWQDMTQRMAALPENERIGIEFSRDKTGKTVMTAKGQISPTAINAILDSGALDPSAKAILRNVLVAMQDPNKSTFDTRYYGVYTRGRGGNRMIAGVKSASQNEILPYSVEMNSKDGVIIRAVDMTKVRERLETAMNKPQFKSLYGSPADALKDFNRYLENITQVNPVESAMLLGGGEKGAKKRNLFYEALGFRLRNGESLVNAPESAIGKSQNTIKSYRVERFAKLQDSGNRFAFEEATTYERAMRNFQPDAFTRETLPNGEAMTNQDGYRILKKTGSSLFRVYDDKGELIGVAKNELGAMRMAQRKFIDGWHGSPHNFMRFLTQKIGTGEGAQAYGYGLYIAENKGVAREYQETLAGTRLRLADGSFADEKASTPGARKILREARATWNNIGDLSGFRQKLLSTQSQARVWAKQGYSTEGNLQYVADVDEVLRLISESTPERTGSLYRVQLNVLPEQLLDWDKPLSEQSEGVKAFMNRAAEKVPFDGIIKNADGTLEQDASGRMLYEWLTKQQKGTNKESQVSNLLSKNGIPGIRYLDQSSRATGEGTSNYVIFDDGLIRIVDRNGKPVGKRLFRDVAEEGYNVRFQPDDTTKATKEEKQTRFQADAMQKVANQEKVGESIDQRTLRYNRLQKQIPSEGNVPAIKLKTGHLLTFTEPHVLFMENKKIDPRDVESGGWVVDGDYRSSDRSDTMRWVDKQLASMRVKERRAERMQQTRFQPVTPEQDAAYLNAVKAGDTAAAQRLVDAARLKPREVFYVGRAEVIRNPTDRDYQQIKAEHRREYPEDRMGETTRFTTDRNGNRYIWRADFGMHSMIEPGIEARERVKVGQNEFNWNMDSAEPVLRDRSGNVIPLSQRFNPESPDIRFQPDSASPNIQVGSNGTRIIKSPSGKFRVYSVTGTLLGIRDTEQAAQKLATK